MNVNIKLADGPKIYTGSTVDWPQGLYIPVVAVKWGYVALLKGAAGPAIALPHLYSEAYVISDYTQAPSGSTLMINV